MHDSTRKKMTQLAALTVTLLGSASSVLAFDTTGYQTELGEYQMHDGQVSAVLRIEDIRASVTTSLDEPGVENGHLVLLSGNCHPNLPDFRAIKNLKTAKKVTYTCPQEGGDTLYYFIEFAEEMIADYDDATTDPNAPEPPNWPEVTVSEPDAPSGEQQP